MMSVIPEFIECVHGRRNFLMEGPCVQCEDKHHVIRSSGIDEILTERSARYGKFEDHAFIAQLLKSCMMGEFDTVRTLLDTSRAAPARVQRQLNLKWESLSADQREALEMNAHKTARILNGDPDYSDSWRDIAGYATLVADRLDGKAK